MKFESSDVLPPSSFLTSGLEFGQWHLQLHNVSFRSFENLFLFTIVLDNHSLYFFEFWMSTAGIWTQDLWIWSWPLSIELICH